MAEKKDSKPRSTPEIPDVVVVARSIADKLLSGESPKEGKRKGGRPPDVAGAIRHYREWLVAANLRKMEDAIRSDKTSVLERIKLHQALSEAALAHALVDAAKKSLSLRRFARKGMPRRVVNEARRVAEEEDVSMADFDRDLGLSGDPVHSGQKDRNGDGQKFHFDEGGFNQDEDESEEDLSNESENWC